MVTVIINSSSKNVESFATNEIRILSCRRMIWLQLQEQFFGRSSSDLEMNGYRIETFQKWNLSVLISYCKS